MILIPILLLLLALAFLLALGVVFRIVFYSPRRGRAENPFDIPSAEQYQVQRGRMKALIQSFYDLPCEHVYIRSHDGLRLHARYYHVADGAPLEIECHGYRGSAIRDFCGGSEIGRSRGHHVLLIDERAHGESDGRVISFGINERLDCLDWIRYSVSRFGPEVKILLAGVSMGAATVLMAAELPLPENVVGIIADCPFSAPEAIIRTVARSARLPDRLLMPLVRLSAGMFGKFDLRAASAVEAVRHTPVPILVIHGEDDRFVPCDMSRQIRAANPDRVTLLTFPGAGHGLSYIVDTPRYTRAVCDFEDSLNFH